MDSQLSKEQIKIYKEAFSFYDKDNEGTIQIKYVSLALKALGFNQSDKEIQKKISGIVSENENTIDFPEFLTMLAYHNYSNTEDEELQEILKRFDKNESGLISQGDLRQFLLEIGEKLTEIEIKQIIQNIYAAMDRSNTKNYLKGITNEVIMMGYCCR